MSESIYSLNLKNNNSCDATLLTKPIFDFHRVIKYCYGSDLRSLMITKKTHRLDPSPLWFYIMIWLTLKLRRAVTKYQELQPIDRGKKISLKSDNNLLLLFFFLQKAIKRYSFDLGLKRHQILNAMFEHVLTITFKTFMN